MHTESIPYKFNYATLNELLDQAGVILQEIIAKTGLTYEEHMLLKSSCALNGIKVMRMVKKRRPDLSLEVIMAVISKEYPLG